MELKIKQSKSLLTNYIDELERARHYFDGVGELVNSYCFLTNGLVSVADTGIGDHLVEQLVFALSKEVKKELKLLRKFRRYLRFEKELPDKSLPVSVPPAQGSGEPLSSLTVVVSEALPAEMPASSLISPGDV
jgi:hypothetical protein